jgi:hypothetical protein
LTRSSPDWPCGDNQAQPVGCQNWPTASDLQFLNQLVIFMSEPRGMWWRSDPIEPASPLGTAGHVRAGDVTVLLAVALGLPPGTSKVRPGCAPVPGRRTASQRWQLAYMRHGPREARWDEGGRSRAGRRGPVNDRRPPRSRRHGPSWPRRPAAPAALWPGFGSPRPLRHGTSRRCALMVPGSRCCRMVSGGDGRSVACAVLLL